MRTDFLSIFWSRRKRLPFCSTLKRGFCDINGAHTTIWRFTFPRKALSGSRQIRLEQGYLCHSHFRGRSSNISLCWLTKLMRTVNKETKISSAFTRWKTPSLPQKLLLFVPWMSWLNIRWWGCFLQSLFMFQLTDFLTHSFSWSNTHCTKALIASNLNNCYS